MSTATVHVVHDEERHWKRSLTNNESESRNQRRVSSGYHQMNEETEMNQGELRDMSGSPMNECMATTIPKAYPQWVSLDSLYALSEDPIHGKVLILARCKTRTPPSLNPENYLKSCTPGGLTWCQRQQSFFRLSWKSAYFSLSAGGVLRIFRSAQERAQSQSLGPSGENLAKWRSPISDAYVVSRIQELPEKDAPTSLTSSKKPTLSKKRDYCGVFRQRCAALGPTPDEADEACEETTDEIKSRAKLYSPTLCTDGMVSTSSSYAAEEDNEDQLLERSRFRTFDLWLRTDIADPNACPILKFAALAGDEDLIQLNEHLLHCCQRFHGPPRKPLRTFSHPLLRSCAGAAVDGFRSPSNY